MPKIVKQAEAHHLDIIAVVLEQRLAAVHVMIKEKVVPFYVRRDKNDEQA